MAMRRWVKYTIGGAIVVVLGFAALAGTGAYYVFRHMEAKPAQQADVAKEMDAVRARFAARKPLVEFAGASATDVRVNRLVHPDGRQSTTLMVLSWDADEGKRVKADVPLWLMRFSSINILSQLGLAPERFKLTLDDLRRFGPGIVVEFRPPKGSHVLVWME
jgi:hypothetical protein